MQLESVNLFYVDSDNDGFVDYVYIQSYVSDTLAPSYVFAYEESAKRDPDTNVWTMNVYVNGEKKDIELANADYELLSENVGKLFVATFDETTGYVDELMLVNEATDGNAAYEVKDTAVDYVTGKLESSDGRLKNTEGSPAVVKTYNTEDATLISTVSDYATMEDVEKASADELAKVGVWVVTNTDGAYTEATFVYVGEKLSESVTPVVTIKATDAKTADEQGKVTVDKDGKITVTFDSETDHATLVYTVDGKMSLVAAPSKAYEYNTTTDSVKKDNPARTITISNEAGTKIDQAVTIKLEWPVAATAEFDGLKITADSTILVDKGQKVTYYKDLDDAMANKTKVNLTEAKATVVKVENEAHSNYVDAAVYGSESAAASSSVNGQNAANQFSKEISDANITAGSYIVVGVGIGGTNYYLVLYV